jgi:hypothetical protein
MFVVSSQCTPAFQKKKKKSTPLLPGGRQNQLNRVATSSSSSFNQVFMAYESIRTMTTIQPQISYFRWKQQLRIRRTDRLLVRRVFTPSNSHCSVPIPASVNLVLFSDSANLRNWNNMVLQKCSYSQQARQKKAKGYQACRNLAQLLYLLSLKRVGHKKLTEEICKKFSS